MWINFTGNPELRASSNRTHYQPHRIYCIESSESSLTLDSKPMGFYLQVSHTCQARIVAKDLNRGVSARKLGISSPTPSVDGLHFVLALAAQRQWQLKGLDVAHAFNSPIPKRSASYYKCLNLYLLS